MRYRRISAESYLDLPWMPWGSDYPHGDGAWPESSRYIAEQLGHLPAEITRRITCENAREFYGLSG